MHYSALISRQLESELVWLLNILLLNDFEYAKGPEGNCNEPLWQMLDPLNQYNRTLNVVSFFKSNLLVENVLMGVVQIFENPDVVMLHPDKQVLFVVCAKCIDFHWTDGCDVLLKLVVFIVHIVVANES
jgi:hypothetical protein